MRIIYTNHWPIFAGEPKRLSLGLSSTWKVRIVQILLDWPQVVPMRWIQLDIEDDQRYFDQITLGSSGRTSQMLKWTSMSKVKPPSCLSCTVFLTGPFSLLRIPCENSSQKTGLLRRSKLWWHWQQGRNRVAALHFSKLTWFTNYCVPLPRSCSNTFSAFPSFSTICYGSISLHFRWAA